MTYVGGVLGRGSKGDEVEGLQLTLIANGFLRPLQANEVGHFGPLTHSAVVHFQQTHLGPDRTPLDVTGRVDASTWWALSNNSGAPQRSYINPFEAEHRIPSGIGGERFLVLSEALRWHARGVREVPNGSNRGPLVDRCFPPWIQKRPGPGEPWCCFWAGLMVHEALGRYPVGRRCGSCSRAWTLAKAQGIAVDEVGYLNAGPVPGDQFIMLHVDEHGVVRRGHTGLVLRTDATHINTLEGNLGNRFGLSRRARHTITGYINFYSPAETPTQWELGTIPPGVAARGASTR